MAASDRLPPRTLPVVYIAFAHLSLLAAFLLLATRPEAVIGFFYHPRLLAVVHLVTLGWITATTLGATYIVGPLALRQPARANWLDTTACVFFIIGALGVEAHFWLAAADNPPHYWGVVSSGAMLVPAFAVVATRTWAALRRGGAPLPVRLHVGAAYANLLLAAALGGIVGINRMTPFLPGSQLQNVYAHAHLAAVGWATLMVAGVGYRLLAMLFPAAPPGDRPVWASFVLLEGGVLALTACLMFRRSWAPYAALVVAAGVLVFLGIVLRMRFHPRPPPAKLRRPDFGVLHVGQALLYLVAAMAAGLHVAFAEGVELTSIWCYGVCGLLGFLAQMIVGVEMRLLPMFAWTEGWAAGGHRELPPSPHVMPRRLLQVVSLAAWTLGVPLLAYGFAGRHEGALVAAAWTLMSGVAAAMANHALVLRHAYR